VKDVPVFKRTEELKKKRVFTPETDIATRVKWATTALENAGFDSIAAFLDAVHTINFPARTTCAELQKQAWEDGIPQTLAVLSRHIAATDSYGKRPYDLTPYRNVTRGIRARVCSLSQAKRPTPARSCDGQESRRYDQSILHKKASDVDGDWQRDEGYARRVYEKSKCITLSQLL
jgi:hypothetical protein